MCGKIQKGQKQLLLFICGYLGRVIVIIAGVLRIINRREDLKDILLIELISA